MHLQAAQAKRRAMMLKLGDRLGFQRGNCENQSGRGRKAAQLSLSTFAMAGVAPPARRAQIKPPRRPQAL